MIFKKRFEKLYEQNQVLKNELEVIKRLLIETQELLINRKK